MNINIILGNLEDVCMLWHFWDYWKPWPYYLIHCVQGLGSWAWQYSICYGEWSLGFWLPPIAEEFDLHFWTSRHDKDWTSTVWCSQVCPVQLEIPAALYSAEETFHQDLWAKQWWIISKFTFDDNLMIHEWKQDEIIIKFPIFT